MAVEMVVNYLKGKLPPAIASQIDQVLDMDGAQKGGIGSMAENLGGMFGKKS